MKAWLAIHLLSILYKVFSFAPHHYRAAIWCKYKSSRPSIKTSHQLVTDGSKNGGQFFISSLSSLYASPVQTKESFSQNRELDITRQQTIIDDFISTLMQSLENQSFESFTLKGPSAPRKRRKMKNKSNSEQDCDKAIEERKEKLRGKYKLITGRLVLLEDKKKRRKRSPPSNKKGESLYVQTTIKYHLATDVAKNWKVDGNTHVEIGLRQLFLAGSQQDEANLSEWGAVNMNQLDIVSGEIITSEGIYTLTLQPHHKASFKLSKKKKRARAKSSQAEEISMLSHDRSKKVPLSPSSDFFQALGISNADGKPVKGMASKLRQCQKFVEIVANLIDSSPTTPSTVQVVDFGCGRGYLTFSLHSFLYNKFGKFMDVQTRGIDRRPKLIAEINGIARSLGKDFDNLNFIEGTIGKTNLQFFDDSSSITNDSSILKIVICLHACDTATDDALWFAICQDTDLIITAPCCQRELRPQIDKHARDNTDDHPLAEMLRHPIYRERFTEMTTDALRATLLEIAGYENTSVFEFIGNEHTAKNSMITATKTGRSLKKQWLQGRRNKLVELAQLYGIKRQRLATLMGESLNANGERPLSLTGMAPLA